MTENEWWSRYVKPRWHNLNRRLVARKVQDVTNKGAPDVDACWFGEAVKIELKYSPTAPVRAETKLTFSRYSKDEPNKRTILSREQVRNLEEWASASGNAYVLIGVDKAWYFITARTVILYNDGMTQDQLRTWASLTNKDIKEVGIVPYYFSKIGDE